MENEPTIIVVDWEQPVKTAGLLEAVRAFREVEAVEPDAFIDVLLTSDETVARLNERFRGVKGPTDVLAFEMDRSGPEGCQWALGQVVISCDRARDRASAAGTGFYDELAELLVHGLLHLVGYAHDGEEDAAEMDERARLIISRISNAGEKS